jgi:hypothetical protein
MCRDNTPCVPAFVDRIEQDETEPLRAFELTQATTGPIYGFIVPKNGKFTFKTADPPVVASEKVKRGRECGNVSTMTGHIDTLVEVGDILERHGKTDFDLNPGMIRSTRKIKNSTRACTLLQLMLRLMDAEQLEGKRWFFRPVAAYYRGHKATFRPGSSKKQ